MAQYWRDGELRYRDGAWDEPTASHRLRAFNQSVTGAIDVFLSHSLRDARVILGIRNLLVAQGLNVYVDWVDDPLLNRANVTPSTAARLRERMRASRTLVYATSRAASSSRWMPWELGYFDGLKGSDRVSIMPIENGGGSEFIGQEYLGLYKLVVKPSGGGPSTAYVVPTSGLAESLRSFGKAEGTYNLYVSR